MRIRASACSITCRARHPNYESDAMSKQKLELTWIGKEKRPKLEPRILLEDPDKSYHAKHRMTASDIFDNRLIFRSEEHTSELQSLMRISYAVFCLKKKKKNN